MPRKVSLPIAVGAITVFPLSAALLNRMDKTLLNRQSSLWSLLQATVVCVSLGNVVALETSHRLGFLLLAVLPWCIAVLVLFKYTIQLRRHFLGVEVDLEDDCRNDKFGTWALGGKKQGIQVDGERTT
jgi:hypothetical protein